ncbi:MAG: glycosyltransferase family 4 protein [Nitrososphaerota archaeon]
MKRKICHITTVHNVFDTRIFYKECNSLKENGYDVYLIAIAENLTEINGIKIISLKKPKNRFLRFIFTNLHAFIKAIKLKADVYHFHDPEFIFWGFILKMILRKKIIYDVHEDYPGEILIKDWIPTKLLKVIISKIFSIIESLLSSRFDALILAQETYLKRFKNYRNQIIILNNYPIIKNYSIDYKKNDNRKDSFNMIYSGSITVERGVWIMIKTIELLIKNKKNIKLYLVGYFPNKSLYEDITKYIENKNLTENVIIYGGNRFVKREEIDKIYTYMDVGLVIFPYNNYFSDKILTKFFEYMLYELPIIATDFPLWKEFMTQNRCGLVVSPENLEEISNKIYYLMKNESLRKEMGKFGREIVLKAYNWDNEKIKLLNLYRYLQC